MENQEDWERLRGMRTDRGRTHISPVRVALLFGTFAIALALFATSYLADRPHYLFAQQVEPLELDMMSTGSIVKPKSYTIRKSVLQKSPGADCIIQADGSHAGDC
ncbi:MAG: hypothetical protein M9944_18735 [Rhizobiaceae bacterium]|nr:hypothetical protein [Rhizobiaceae bacterium]